ncbi:hypothetical protein SDC9_191645 [bioreactor metagenome]|uniref:Gas vesicle protein GvpG n=1 Tax=bioreactor metagenome TaxID=1076179 RepID=A0A645I6Q8_9ZZZZ
MGLIKGLADLVRIIYEEGEKEWMDELKYTEALNELYIELEKGGISEGECEEKEHEILKQLGTLRKFKKEQGYL